MSNINMNWQQAGLTVYALNEQNVNDFSFYIQGNGRSGHDPKKLLKVASMALAAPDMYQALRAVIDDSHAYGLVQAETLDKCDAALAKADGGE